MDGYFDHLIAFWLKFHVCQRQVLWTNRLTIFVHANPFAPLMDVICPQRFLIECVDAK